MLAVARSYVKTRAVAEEVVQEAWLGVLKGLDRFEGRSSLKTWILRIVVNTAKTRGVREARIVPFSSLAPEGEEARGGPGALPRRPTSAFPGHWNGYPGDWSALPEDGAARARDARRGAARDRGAARGAAHRDHDARRRRAAARRRSATRSSSREGNQRVLLHRARSRVRAALERHLDG